MRIAYLDGPRLRRSLLAACEYTQYQRRELNRINVFPVPDGDTGTNLALTVRAIADHLRKNRDRAFYAVARDAAQAAILGARGNAGMMLSHFLLGFADGATGKVRIGVREFGYALRAGTERLDQSVERPVEGTILTVMRDTARAALESTFLDFQQLMVFLAERARLSLERTPDLLPALRKAGVVDAGGKGFVSLLEGVVRYINGEPLVGPGVLPDAASDAAHPEAVFDPAPDVVTRESGVAAAEYPLESEPYRFCTEALVRGANLPDQSPIREWLRERGDSLIVIRSDDVLKVHVHTDRPDEVFAYLKTLGKLVTHKAEDMRAQHAVAGRAAQGHLVLTRRPVGIVTDSAADLSEEVIRAHGIKIVPLVLVRDGRSLRDGIDITAEEFHRVLLEGGDLPTTSQPPPGAFLEAYQQATEEAEEVVAIILGSNLSGTLKSAEAAAQHFRGARVHVVDSLGASLLQGLMVLKATELAELATPPSDIVGELKRLRSQSGVILTLDSLDRLMASGRIGRGRAWLASVLGLKPVLDVPTDGRAVGLVGKAVGRKRAFSAVLGALRHRIPSDVRKVRFGVIHVGCPEVLPRVSEALRREYGDVEILTAPATPVLATHTGVGTWAIAYMVED